MKLRQVAKNDPMERLTASVSRSTVQMLEAYREHYRQVYGEEIERSRLVEEILKEFISSDKDFAKAREQHTKS